NLPGGHFYLYGRGLLPALLLARTACEALAHYPASALTTVSIASVVNSLRLTRWFASAVRRTPAMTICFGSCPKSRISSTTFPTTRHISWYNSSSFVRFPIIIVSSLAHTQSISYSGY